MVGGACVTVTLLMCVAGSQALDLLRAAAASGKLRLCNKVNIQDSQTSPTVRCWCASLPNLTTCSWPEPAHSPPTHYIATYRERRSQTLAERCQLVSTGSSSPTQILASSSSSDRVWHCHLPSLKLFTDYIINVTAVYPRGSRSNLTSFMLEDIVKPDPPIDLRVSPHHNRNVSVEWSPPSTWADLDIFPLKYQLLYQWENRGMSKSINLGPIETTKIELKEMTPGRTYLFQVCARELLGLGECSGWSSPVQITIPRTNL